MSSPSPGPLGGGDQLVNMLSGPSRRVSTNNFMSLGITSNASGQTNRALTPPVAQQHSPNSFLAGLTSRLLSNKQRDVRMPNTDPNTVFTTNEDLMMKSVPYKNSVMKGGSFGVVGGGPPSLDHSAFPPLGGSSSNTLPSISSYSRSAYVGMVSKENAPANSGSTEFKIDSEDFPALPGSNPNLRFGNSHENSSISSASTAMSLGAAGNISAGMGHHGNMSMSGTGDINAIKMKRGIQTSKEGKVTNIPPGMVVDQFGMVGLLTFIRAAEPDPQLVTLALGTDLTTLGLNLNSSEPLYQSFAGPWTDQPLRPTEIDYPVPTEYLINSSIREKLAPIKIKHYTDDLLFFLYYMYPGDVIQILAASELYLREWRYHKDERIWITRAPNVNPIEKTQTYERGTYYFFDPHNWRKVAKEFHLEYERLENCPAVVNLKQQPVMQT